MPVHSEGRPETLRPVVYQGWCAAMYPIGMTILVGGARLGQYAHLTASLSQYTAMTDTIDSPAPEQATASEGSLPAYWSGVIGFEGVTTGDGRVIEEGALEWDTPIPLRFVLEDNGGHDGAVSVGRVLDIRRSDTGALLASGEFDLGSQYGREAARLVARGVLDGVSMDLDSISFEIRSVPDIDDGDDDGEPVVVGEGVPDRLDDGRIVTAEYDTDDELMVTTSARVRGVTLVSIPAFDKAKITAVDTPPAEAYPSPSLVASGVAPVDPPRAWLTEAEADEPTPLTITDEGHIFGHLALWDTCHTGQPSGEGVCVMAPKSQSDYAYFHTGAVKTAEGEQVPTGVIRFRTGHAGMNLSASSAAAHYDNTGLAGADVHASDGRFGVWVTGAIRPTLTPEQVRELRAAPLSGDWRYIGGHLDLIGALAVNLPGFPVPRPRGLVASGELSAIVSAGVLPPAPSTQIVGLSSSDRSILQSMIDREKNHRRQEMMARVENAKTSRVVSRASILAAKMGNSSRTVGKGAGK